jgi:hypothetical protein
LKGKSTFLNTQIAMHLVSAEADLGAISYASCPMARRSDRCRFVADQYFTQYMNVLHAKELFRAAMAACSPG